MLPVSKTNPLLETSGGQHLLKMLGISKSFPGVQALRSVDFYLKRGEVHVLAGENGAGKSTLSKIISGVYQPETGEIYFGNERVHIKTPAIARSMGIGTVYQELSLVPGMTVLENLFLGMEKARGIILDKREMRQQAEDAIERAGFDIDIDLDSAINRLSVAKRQLVEIARHFIREVRLLILDEPTSALTKEEIDKLFITINRLKRDGVGIIYISHRLNEIRYIGDRVTILRDGERVITIDIDEATEDRLIELMTGREVENIFPSLVSKPGATLLELEGLCTESGLKDISFSLRAGEILGVGGLIGAGKRALARAIFGLEKITAGKMVLEGRPLRKIDPSSMIRKGVAYVPADRRTEGILALMTVRENIVMPSLQLFTRRGVLQKDAEKKKARELSERLKIKTPSIETLISKLSGGSQQKAIVARALIRKTKVFVFHELTRGIDVATKIEIYKFMQDLASQGAGIIFVSSEMAELLNLTHRVAVVRHGKLAETFETLGLNEEILLRSYFGIRERKENIRKDQTHDG